MPKPPEKPAAERKPLATTYYARRAPGHATDWEAVEVTLFMGGAYEDKVLQRGPSAIVDQRLLVLLERVRP